MRNVDKHEIKKRKIPAKIQLIKCLLTFVQQNKHIVKKKADEQGQRKNGAKNLIKHKEKAQNQIRTAEKMVLFCASKTALFRHLLVLACGL